MKKGKLFLKHRYGKAEPMALDPDSPRTSEQAKDIPKQTDGARRVYNLINLFLQMRAYAHKIAFTWYNTRDIHAEAPLNKCNAADRTSIMATGPEDEAKGLRSPRFRRLNANGNTLDEKGKKYGSFNPTSVNSFCSVAGGRYSPQVGDFDPATSGGF